MSRKYVAVIVVLIGAVFLSSPICAGYDIGSSGSSIFSRLTNFMQDVVDLIDGPLAVAVVVVSLIAAIAFWNFAPGRSEWVGRAFRAVASGFFLLDIALLINYMRA